MHIPTSFERGHRRLDSRSYAIEDLAVNFTHCLIVFDKMSRFRNGPVAPGIAFITGGARGIGNSIACSFAKEGSKGVALIDICDEEGFKEGKANVEKYGTEVGSMNITTA